MYLKRVCSPGFRPPNFGRGETVWLAGVMQARAQGFSNEQAALIAGMRLNRLGPANRLRRPLTDDRIYGGSPLAKGLGAVSALLLGVALVALWWDWRYAVSALAGALITSFAGYRLSGGRHNPGLVESAWESKTDINLVGDATGTWEAKVTAMFSLLEQDFPGRYAEALEATQLGQVPPAVQGAYDAARRSPSHGSWLHLKAIMLANPPSSSRGSGAAGGDDRDQGNVYRGRRSAARARGPETRIRAARVLGGVAAVILLVFLASLTLRVKLVAGPDSVMWVDEQGGQYFAESCRDLAEAAAQARGSTLVWARPRDVEERTRAKLEPNRDCAG